MVVGELIEILQEIADEHGRSLDVRIASQPNWPLAFTIGNVRYIEGGEQRSGRGDAVWIADGCHPYGENPYTPKEAWEEE